jgi:COMPASS component SWD2
MAVDDTPSYSHFFPCVANRRHHDHCILFAGKGSPTQSVGQRHAVNYWSLYDNKILRKFRGHTDKVTCISMCPSDDSFLTSSLDRTVRLWTAGVAGCVAEMKLPEETERDPLAVFDSTGLVFAVTAAMRGRAGHYLHLYDARNYAAGAFAELKVSQPDLEAAIQSHLSVAPDRDKELSQVDWTSMEFNVSGNQILVGAHKGMCLLLDGFEGSIQRVLVPPLPSERPAVASYTPDDKTILQGNEDGSIACWDVNTGTIKTTLTGHPGPVTCVASNPKHAQIASTCSQAALWIW